MNLLEMFKQLTDEEKQEFIGLIKKEAQTVITASIPKNNTDFINFQKEGLAKIQLFRL